MCDEPCPFPETGTAIQDEVFGDLEEPLVAVLFISQNETHHVHQIATALICINQMKSIEMLVIYSTTTCC
jgi:hypothetical protein